MVAIQSCAIYVCLNLETSQEKSTFSGHSTPTKSYLNLGGDAFVGYWLLLE